MSRYVQVADVMFSSRSLKNGGKLDGLNLILVLDDQDQNSVSAFPPALTILRRDDFGRTAMLTC